MTANSFRKWLARAWARLTLPWREPDYRDFILAWEREWDKQAKRLREERDPTAREILEELERYDC